MEKKLDEFLLCFSLKKKHRGVKKKHCFVLAFYVEIKTPTEVTFAQLANEGTNGSLERRPREISSRALQNAISTLFDSLVEKLDELATIWPRGNCG